MKGRAPWFPFLLGADDLLLAAAACDLYADEFPESIDAESPELAAERLHTISAALCEAASSQKEPSS